MLGYEISSKPADGTTIIVGKMEFVYSHTEDTYGWSYYEQNCVGQVIGYGHPLVEDIYISTDKKFEPKTYKERRYDETRYKEIKEEERRALINWLD